MDRNQKNEVVSGLKGSFAKAKIAMVLENRGLQIACIVDTAWTFRTAFDTSRKWKTLWHKALSRSK